MAQDVFFQEIRTIMILIFGIIVTGWPPNGIREAPFLGIEGTH